MTPDQTGDDSELRLLPTLQRVIQAVIANKTADDAASLVRHYQRPRGRALLAAGTCMPEKPVYVPVMICRSASGDAGASGAAGGGAERLAPA